MRLDQTRFVRMRSLEQYTGMHRSTIRRKQRHNAFPLAVERTQTSSLYDLDQVEKWIEVQRRVSDSDAAVAPSTTCSNQPGVE